MIVQTRMKELKFSHITKTAGTSIEDAAKSCGILWGRYHMVGGATAYWHDPIATIPAETRSLYDWFIVVRNPYDRIVSEYFCPWMGSCKGTPTVQQFNETIRANINRRLTFRRHSGGGHYMEQWRYMDPSVVVHVLHFEELSTAFPALMNTYGLSVRLDAIRNKGRPKQFSVNDLDATTIRLINEVYQKDFELFGYTMRSP
jgi:hypothetical protein